MCSTRTWRLCSLSSERIHAERSVTGKVQEPTPYGKRTRFGSAAMINIPLATANLIGRDCLGSTTVDKMSAVSLVAMTSRVAGMTWCDPDSPVRWYRKDRPVPQRRSDHELG